MLFLGILINGMQIPGLASFDKAVATGIVILLAVSVDTLVLSGNRRDVSHPARAATPLSGAPSL